MMLFTYVANLHPLDKQIKVKKTNGDATLKFCWGVRVIFELQSADIQCAPALTPMHNITLNSKTEWMQLLNIREIKNWLLQAGLKLYSYGEGGVWKALSIVW